MSEQSSSNVDSRPIPDEFFQRIHAMREAKRAAINADDVGGPMMQFSADDYGNADSVLLLHGNKFRYCGAYGWLHYVGTHWDKENAECALDVAIAETLVLRRQFAVEARKEEIVKKSEPSTRHIRDAKAQLASRLSVSVDGFDATPDLLNCVNGVVDLRTGALMPHDANQMFTHCAPVRYNPDAYDQGFDDFMIQSVTGGKVVVDWMQEFFGYCATGLTRLEIMLYIFGKTRAGKGTFVEAIMKALDTLAHGVDFNTFSAKRDGDASNFDLAGLKGCRLVVADESSRYQELNAAKAKQMTGGNMIRCSFKHRDHFIYRPQFKIVLVSNFPIQADPDDSALWERVRVIEFPNSHAGAEDTSLKERFKSPAAQEAILNWMVQGAIRFYARGNASNSTPQEMIDLTKSQRDALDYVGQWIGECCDVDAGAWQTNESLYESYEHWCKSNHVMPKMQRGLSITLKTKGFAVGIQHKIGAKNYKCVDGIKVKSGE